MGVLVAGSAISNADVNRGRSLVDRAPIVAGTY
jgi:hypothetical protein